MTHLKFPSIEQFDAIFARETWEGLAARRKLSYRSKIKLHGANLGISITPEGTVFAQSRKTILTPEDDLHGFAQWLDPQKSTWERVLSPEIITFYGEWAGPGIAKGDAVQCTDRKRFYIFAIGIGQAPHHQNLQVLTSRLMITNPKTIEDWLPAGLDRDQVRVLPYEDDEPIVFDFNDEAQVQSVLDRINAKVESVAECDPYISRTFGVDHRGEGFVLVPHTTAKHPITYETYARTAFKAKTERHRVRKQKRAASPREPLPETATQFIEAFVTPQRVAQAIDEVCAGRPDKTFTGSIIGWITEDIQKEAATEIALLDIEFSRLKGEIAKATRVHFMSALEAA